MNKRYIFLIGLMLLACNLGIPSAPTPVSDLFATLQASTPSGNFTPSSPIQTATIVSNDSTTVAPAPTTTGDTASIPMVSPADGVTGRIVFTCQVFKVQASNQICIINADGTGFRRITEDSSVQHFYPSWAPEGKSVVFSVFREENIIEIHEMTLADGDTNQLTDKLGVLTAPEISPDGRTIVFSRWTPTSDRNQIWLMNRDGSDVRNVPKLTGWDPTWSPDGKLILFASDENGSTQLFAVKENGRNQYQISNLPAIRGRSDWSPNGEFIVTYSGDPWHREIYLMNADGSNAHQISPSGGNAQGPSISPDGQWIAFTAYYDHYGDDHGCEIYIMRIDGSNLRRVTNNDYCDYQPRWGQ